MALEVYRYRIEGVSPLLMHSPQALMEGGPAGPSTKKVPTPEAEAEKGAYRDEGNFHPESVWGQTTCVSSPSPYKPELPCHP